MCLQSQEENILDADPPKKNPEMCCEESAHPFISVCSFFAVAEYVITGGNNYIEISLVKVVHGMGGATVGVVRAPPRY